MSVVLVDVSVVPRVDFDRLLLQIEDGEVGEVAKRVVPPDPGRLVLSIVEARNAGVSGPELVRVGMVVVPDFLVLEAAVDLEVGGFVHIEPDPRELELGVELPELLPPVL